MKYLFTIFTLLVNIIVHAQNPCNPSGKPYSSFPEDTTITLPSGTTITMNRCEFFDKRDCLEITEITTPADLEREGLNMRDSEGNILISCGMLKIDLKNCDKPCFDTPIKVKIKMRFNCNPTIDTLPNLYFNTGSGWMLQSKNSSNLVRSGNETYMTLETKCSMFINCDVPKKGNKTKFIAPKGFQITGLRLGIDCPLFYSEEIISTPKRRVKVRLLCTAPQNVKVQAMMIGKDRDSTQTAKMILSDLRHGRRKMGCRESKRTFFGRIFSFLDRNTGQFKKKYYLPS